MTLVLPAYAKLNLTLDVTSRRPDGYHEIGSVMQSIDLHDLLTVEACDCKIFEAGGLPVEGENLVLKAARQLEAHLGRMLTFKLRLHKRIPVASGLGGGSADAATFLRAAVALYQLKISYSDLVAIAAAVGQDVPFFLRGGTALSTGRGSTVEPLPALPGSWAFVLVAPPVQVSTRDVFQRLDRFSQVNARTDRLVRALKSGSSLSPEDFGNDLEATAATLHPELKAFMEPIKSALPDLRMTGSGGAYYAAFPSLTEARRALGEVRRRGVQAWLCRPVPAWA